MRKRNSCLVTSLATMALSFSSAQEAPSADFGVSMSHYHVLTKDVEAQKRFWLALGGTPTTLGKQEMIRFPNVYIVLMQGSPADGTIGSLVDHIGFKVRNLKDFVTKCQEQGAPMLPPSSPTQAYCLAPDGVKVELSEDPSLTTPIANQHIHYFTSAVPEMQAWYANMFGARPGMRLKFEAADLPGVNLTFAEAPKALACTRGRALDHIGFEVKNLERFCKRLENEGVHFDRPYRKVPETSLAVAFLTGAWGSYIELTEGLAPGSN